MERSRRKFWRFFTKDAPAPKATELLNLCKEMIKKLSAQHSSSESSGDYVMNRHQCGYVIGKLRLGTQVTLENIQSSPLIDEKTTPVLEELHSVLQQVESILNASRVTTAQWPRAAMEQGEMKETFSRMLYDIQWHTSVLLSILVDNSGESRITFSRELCDGELTVGDEFALLVAMKEDEESLEDRLRSVNLENPTAKYLAENLLKLRQDNYNNTSIQSTENREPSTDSTGSTLVTSGLIFLNPVDVDFNGVSLGRGASAQVRKFNLLGGKYAVKIFDTFPSEHSTGEQQTNDCFDREVAALQGLGQHPYIVRLLCYSKEETKCYLIMEEMHKDLSDLLSEVLHHRKKKNMLPYRPFSLVQSVGLMLQVAEGTRYIHSKSMAHRDLKSGNILVNLADPSSPSSSRVSAVKIADFGLSKTKMTTRTYSNQTWNRGTRAWMAPEVIRGEGDPTKAKFNLQRADVYSFAIICFEILTGENPTSKLPASVFRVQVKVDLRPTLPDDCPVRLASLIKKCWLTDPHMRPLFPEICKELRYIKGLILRGDPMSLGPGEILPFRSMGQCGRAQLQGPWGAIAGNKFHDMGTSIKRIKVGCSRSPRFLRSMEVEYEFVKTWKKVYGICYNDHIFEEVVFDAREFITHISGYVSYTNLPTTDGGERSFKGVGSITIHTNMGSYGPFGDEEGEQFTSDSGRVIGFHGGDGQFIDMLGVVIILCD